MNNWKKEHGKDAHQIKTSSGLRLSIHRHIHYEPDDWLMSVAGLGISMRVLKSKSEEDAKTEAISYVLDVLNSYIADLTKVGL